MTSLNGKLEVLKQDARGRVRTPEDRQRALLDEFEKSGLSGAKFALLAGIKYATFAGWAAKRRRERKALAVSSPTDRNGGGPVRLVEAVVDGGLQPQPRPALPAPAGAGLLIELSGGGRMRVESPVQLRMAVELLAMMAQTGCGRC